jgi:prepilin-type N-terminal cleavage/methylation domain-containing protein
MWRKSLMSRKYFSGFTLAELLISLAILGVIAAFAIPKVLQAQQDEKLKSVAKETIAMVSGAYDAYRLSNAPNANTGIQNLVSYMNYVRVQTAANNDIWHGLGGYWGCNNTLRCLELHNGAKLAYYTGNHFGQTGNNNYIYFLVDADGVADGKNKSILMYLYFNGRITSNIGSQAGSQTYEDGSPSGWPPVWNDPPWFSWDWWALWTYWTFFRSNPTGFVLRGALAKGSKMRGYSHRLEDEAKGKPGRLGKKVLKQKKKAAATEGW